jgi:mycoredoxin
VTAKDILVVVIIPLILAEFGPWCGWLAARLLPTAAKLRYGDSQRVAVRLEEWSGDLGDIPGQLTKLAYATGQLLAGTAAAAQRKAKARRKVRGRDADDLVTAQLSSTGVSSPGQLTMYSTQWCGFCRRLKSQLSALGIEIFEVDIESDLAAADYVMSINGGEQTVPTILLPDGTTLVNPSAAQVRAQLAAVSPG